MKKLLAVLFVAIIAAGVASPVYAQEPDDLPLPCSDFYWDDTSPEICVAYYESHYPEVVTGCGELEAFACVEYYEEMLYAPEKKATDQTVDVPAGGEGPIIVWSMTDIIGIAFGGLLLTVALIFIVGDAISEWVKNKRK